MRRALVPLALASSLALAACGSGSTTTGDSPTSPAATSAGSSAPTGSSSPTTATSTTPPPATPPASSTPAAPTTTATSSAPTGGGSGDSTGSPAVHTYQHLKVTLPVADNAVPAAPAGLTAYLRSVLKKDWGSLGRTAECRKSPTFILDATRADGFAYGSHEINVTPSGGCEKAATMGGGYRAVWKDVGGTWKEVLAMQDVPDCTEFTKWDVPSAILGKDAQCYDGNTVVAYHHG